MDYYQGKNDDMLFETLEERTNHKGKLLSDIWVGTTNSCYHLDHCIEALRQKLMCTPDVNVYSYHWLSTLDHPFTDFTTQHQCVNWSRFAGWLGEHTVKHGVLDKPAGAEILF